MKVGGHHRFPSRGKIVSLSIIALAVAVALVAAFVGATRPSSNDASIDADIVHVAAAVGGRIIRIGVAENTRVAKGAFLFQIDPVPYRLAVDQAAADLDIAEA